MKKLITLLVTVCALFTVSACGGDGSSSSSTSKGSIDLGPSVPLPDQFKGSIVGKEIYIVSIGMSAQDTDLQIDLKAAGVEGAKIHKGDAAQESKANLIHAKDISEGAVVFLLLGYSGKTMTGCEGNTITEENARAKEITDKAGITVFSIHIGGSERRGGSSDQLLGSIANTELLIVSNNGNVSDSGVKDDKLENMAKENNVPYAFEPKAADLVKILTALNTPKAA